VRGPAGLTAALGNLANHAEVRICVEAVPGPSVELSSPVEIDAKDTTVERILDEMVRQDPSYTYRERLGVIEVLPVGADANPNDCLNMVIPLFRVHYPWRYAWNSVKCEVDLARQGLNRLVPDPVLGPGCTATGLVLRFASQRLLEATFERQTLRDILDQLVAMAGNMAWVAYYKKPPPTCENLELGPYQPKTWYPAHPEHEDGNWVEGLPKTCQSCHYHAP